MWYGSDSVETSVYESVYHWYKSLLCDAGFDRQVVIAEREVYQVACGAALLDFRAASTEHSDLVHPANYSFCKSVGARSARDGREKLRMSFKRSEPSVKLVDSRRSKNRR